MKWIGQHIYDLTSRFRSDVYLEDISTSTETDMLVVDSTGKVTKRAIDAITVDVSDFMTNGVNNRVLTATGTDAINAEANLTFDGSTLNIGSGASTSDALFIDTNNLTTGSAINLDIDDALTASATKSLAVIDYDKAGVTASGQTSDTTGLDITLHDNVEGNVGTVKQTGINIDLDMDHAGGGTHELKGIVVKVGADGTAGVGDIRTGVEITTRDSHADIKMISHQDAADYATIGVTTSGATTLTTVDAAAAAAHFKIEADGDITLDAAGQIKLEPGTSVLWDSLALTGIQASGEPFSDDDVSLMTSAAIDDAIIKGGSTTIIKVLPYNFMSNEDGGANKSVQFRDDTIIGVRATANDSELYAFVEIPIGKTATAVIVYGNDSGNVVEVFESDINAGALTDKTHASGCVVGTACDITDVAADTTNYLVIKVTITSYTNDIVYGAAVTISG